MTDTTRALTTTGDSSHIELAVAGWLDAHSKNKKTVETLCAETPLAHKVPH